MPDDNPPVRASTPPASARACDLCRKRKIRCDRTFPCSNCLRMGADCKILRHTAKQKRKRTLISSEYEEKIDQIDKGLTRLTRLVEKLNADSSTPPGSTDLMTSSHSTSRSGPPNTTLRTVPETRPPSNRAVVRSNGIAENEVLIEGQSSLTAHSEFAIGFLHNVVTSYQVVGDGSEITGLLDTLRHIVDAFNHHRLSPKLLFPLAQPVSSRDRGSCPMPPLEAVFAVIHKAQEENNFAHLCLSHLLSPRSLSDLSLKIYFSKEYSDAEFIIVNTALVCLTGDTDIPSNDEYKRLQLMCRTNLETALSGLSLYVKASYNMILALVLGAIYAIDNSNPSLAWTLVSAASQSSHYLGLHTRAGCMDTLLPAPTQRQLLFWMVYFLEKTLCLRLGRSSTIPDCDITAPWPGDLQVSRSYALDYFHQQVKLASLAGRIYQQLYSGNALQLPAEVRTNQALELSQQLNRYGVEAREANKLWDRSTTNGHGKEQIRFISASDEILRLSMLTLIYRAVQVQRNSITTFNQDCVSSARTALECHQEFVTELGAKSSFLVSVHINWTILFTPFIPFIVLFCHVIETGDVEDLSRMQTFVKSMEGSCHNSGAIAKHHRLFQVFYSVAARYTELMCSSAPMQEEQRKLKSQVNAQLSALGLQPNGPYILGHPTQETAQVASSAIPGMEILGNGQAPQREDWPEQGLLLGNWFSFNQQMMGLMDQSDLPF